MTVLLDSACRFICERGGWQVTNLHLQKLLYLSEMMHIGETSQRLTDGRYEAWDYGPVEPSVYRRVRAFGAAPIRDVFWDAIPYPSGDSRLGTLSQVCDALLGKRPGELVDITHWEKGAWAKNYVPGTRGIPIPEHDIAAEYAERIREFASRRAA